MNYQSFFKAVQKWQVEVMGNTCTECYGNNQHTQCRACGWWGKVNPADPHALLKDTGPKIDNFT